MQFLGKCIKHAEKLCNTSSIKKNCVFKNDKFLACPKHFYTYLQLEALRLLERFRVGMCVRRRLQFAIQIVFGRTQSVQFWHLLPLYPKWEDSFDNHLPNEPKNVLYLLIILYFYFEPSLEIYIPKCKTSGVTEVLLDYMLQSVKRFLGMQPHCVFHPTMIHYFRFRSEGNLRKA